MLTLLGAERAVEVEQQGGELGLRRLRRLDVPGLAAGFPVRQPLREPLLRLARAQDGDELGLAALAMALAQLGGKRRALAVEAHALGLGSAERTEPALEQLGVALHAALVAFFQCALHLLFREFAVFFGEALLEMADLRRTEPVQQAARLEGCRPQRLPYPGDHRIVTPIEVLPLDTAAHARGGLFAQPRVLRQGAGAVPGEESGQAPVELLGLRALEIEVVVRLPAQKDVGVLIGEARGAAGRQQRQREENEKPFCFHQKLSTVICPGVPRRFLRKPRSASAAAASFSIAGLPHSMNCERSGEIGRAAASRRPSRMAAGIRPSSAWGVFSLERNLTVLNCLPCSRPTASIKSP